MPTDILLLGASGIPGRYILSSLLKLSETQSTKLNITVLKRSTHTSDPAPTATTTTTSYSTTYIDDFSNTAALASLFDSLQPTVIISALNAEPAPVLDNLVVDAILQYRHRSPPIFINGYTLDLLHPSVSTSLHSSAIKSIQPKLDFAHRLSTLAAAHDLSYCTIIPASFLDYCLVKGYAAVDLDTRTATLVDGGTAPLTGCSLRFVGDVVAYVVRCLISGDGEQVRNTRLRIAETVYSGKEMVECVERITGNGFVVTHEKAEDMLAKGQVIRYLNWNGAGAADFRDDGLKVGEGVVERKGLEEICRKAIEDGVGVFEGIGR